MDSVFQEKDFLILMAIGIFIMLTLAFAFVLFFNYSRKKFLEEQIQRQNLALRHQEVLLHSNIMTQEAERKRIARDLHDEIGSKLNVIFLNIHRLKEVKNIEENLHSIIDEIESVINTTIDSTRLISHELLPPTLEEFGLEESIRELQYSYNNLGKVHIEFSTLNEDNASIKNKLIELNLFRVIQELIKNSIGHGSASNITIKMGVDESKIKLIYQDNGSGFDKQLLKAKKGLGMKNIESRMQMVYADYNYITSPGEGMTFVAELKQNNTTKS